MLRLQPLIIENTVQSDLPEIVLMSPSEFEKDGGYNVGVGAQGKLYTLRSDENQQSAFYVGDGLSPQIRSWRSSYYQHNLGKDWNEVVNRLPEIFKRKGYGKGQIIKLYVPGFVSGKLDPNNPPITYVPSDTMEFGKYSGKKIEDLKKDTEGLNYLLYLATSYTPSPKTNRDRYAFMQHLTDLIKPELDVYIKEKGESEKKVQIEKQKKIDSYKPLVDFLRQYTNSPFAQSIADGLERGVEPRGRATNIVQDMWAKYYGGRSNSKAYQNAYKDFDDKFASVDPKAWGYETNEAIDMPPPTHQPPAIVQTVNVSKPSNFTVGDAVVIATLIGEAGGEGDAGMQAVMNVISNRAKGNTDKFKDVALKRKQFSMWNLVGRTDNDLMNHVRELKRSGKWSNDRWQKAIEILNKAKSKRLDDLTSGANHYYASWLDKKGKTPDWADPSKMTASIGNHKFFKI